MDVEKTFSEGTADGLSDSKYFVDSHHLSALGYRVAAREIVKALAARRFAPPRCPGPWREPRVAGPYGLIMDGMKRELGLPATYWARPEMTLARDYSFFAEDNEDPWFVDRARAWMADAFRIDEREALRVTGENGDFRGDSPIMTRLLSEVRAGKKTSRHPK